MVCRCASPAIHAQRAIDDAYSRSRSEEDAAKKREKALTGKLASLTPDPTMFEIVEAHDVAGSLVLKVRFPSCKACAYEGTKILVYLNASPIVALRWRRLDPHFRAPAERTGPNEAPSPDARFPASPSGLADALAYARGKARS